MSAAWERCGCKVRSRPDLAPDPGRAVAQCPCAMPCRCGDGLLAGFGAVTRLPRRLQQSREAGFPLGRNAGCRASAVREENALPAAGRRPVSSLGRTVARHDVRRHEGLAAPRSTCPGKARGNLPGALRPAPGSGSPLSAGGPEHAAGGPGFAPASKLPGVGRPSWRSVLPRKPVPPARNQAISPRSSTQKCRRDGRARTAHGTQDRRVRQTQVLWGGLHEYFCRSVVSFRSPPVLGRSWGAIAVFDVEACVGWCVQTRHAEDGRQSHK